MENLTSIVVALVGFMGSVIVALVSGFYLSRVEPTKSKLKKTEILFGLRVTATKEFNAIFQKYAPLNLGELHDGEIYGKKRWEEIRKDVSKYKAQNGYVFENKAIDKILDDILLSLDYSVNPTYMALDANGNDGEANAFEEECYKDTLILMEKANEMIKKYLFEEANKA
ncbi:hypothetical protein [Campylobacter showae]|jgi:hypothetical protein|uniref:hypothetical protein n=1 Tax=Campylobacter showae TaxID=204 RepID=UPI0028D35B03|nr:hypothetical protein [Campylobacter showae]